MCEPLREQARTTSMLTCPYQKPCTSRIDIKFPLLCQLTSTTSRCQKAQPNEPPNSLNCSLRSLKGRQQPKPLRKRLWVKSRYPKWLALVNGSMDYNLRSHGLILTHTQIKEPRVSRAAAAGAPSGIPSLRSSFGGRSPFGLKASER